VKNNKGQAAVEYILMVAVVVAMITSIFGVVRRRFLGDASKCNLAANRKMLSCKINGVLTMGGQPGQGKKFQYYPFKK
jgi:Flp pilus assembly pilin Flp